jgi:16S rRNA (cytidine1402-2'-O)-methyltransferase
VLTLISTPIGHLGDLSLRARTALESCDLVACEDTRRTGQLLHHLGIKKRMLQHHDHNERESAAGILKLLHEGTHVALVTDAGTPLISDPGYRLVAACRAAGLAVTVIPGPSAILAALAGSGLPPHPFYFGGFLPVKSGRRKTEWERALGRDCTSVYFESPFRLVRSLENIASLDPDRYLCVARELTKAHEEFRTSTASHLLTHFQAHPPKGEITLVVAGKLFCMGESVPDLIQEMEE